MSSMVYAVVWGSVTVSVNWMFISYGVTVMVSSWVFNMGVVTESSGMVNIVAGWVSVGSFISVSVTVAGMSVSVTVTVVFLVMNGFVDWCSVFTAVGMEVGMTVAWSDAVGIVMCYSGGVARAVSVAVSNSVN